MSPAMPAPHVLVLDDDKATLSLYRDLLTDGGYAVSLRGYLPVDPAEVDRVRPDLILLDLVFSGDDAGWRFLQSIKTDARTASLPVLVCTAAAPLVARLQDQLDAWCCGVVLKPFDIDRLLEAVAACLAGQTRDRAAG